MPNVTFNKITHLSPIITLQSLKPKTPHDLYTIRSPNSFVKIKFHFRVLFLTNDAIKTATIFLIQMFSTPLNSAAVQHSQDF